MHLNIEIKARCKNQDRIRELLRERHADFRGIDLQIDTYFKTPHGRLKLRQGNIENNLIYYVRSDQAGPKASNVILYKSTDSPVLRKVLSESLGINTIVSKEREIYFIDNVKFHLDKVPNLGTFVEIEAIDEDGSIGREKLREQCDHYMELFEIRDEDLVEVSYCDLLLSMRR